MKQTSQEVAISQDVSPVVDKATKLEIVNSETMEMATEFLSKLNIENDRIIAEKERITKPLNEALKVERARWAPAEKVLKSSIELIRRKMGSYQMFLVNKRREEEKKIDDRIGDGKGKLKMETAMKKIDNLEIVENKVETESGSISFRTDYVLEIVSLKDIPLEYMEPKESVILRELKAGKQISGVKLKEVMTPINKRS